MATVFGYSKECTGEAFLNDVELTICLLEQTRWRKIRPIMRRTSLTPRQAQQIAKLLQRRRIELALSLRQVAARAGLNSSTLFSIEEGTNLSPSPETLKVIASVLQLNVTDLYAVAGWLPAGDLPTLKPYLRTKYGDDLPEAAVQELERYFDQLTAQYGRHGPVDGEDER